MQNARVTRVYTLTHTYTHTHPPDPINHLCFLTGNWVSEKNFTARCVEDETRNAELNGNRNPEWWRNLSQLQIQIKQKSRFAFVPKDTSKFKSNQNLNSTLYREIP